MDTKFDLNEKDNLILKAVDINQFLTNQDFDKINVINSAYDIMIKDKFATPVAIEQYNGIGKAMQEISKNEERLHIYPFEMPHETHAEVSRLISKLRDVKTEKAEFTYYTQRAYEMLFNFAYGSKKKKAKHYIQVKTPVDYPCDNYAFHKVNNIDNDIENTVMCVMMRGALLPSIIMSKEIQEYSSSNHITPFHLFKIQRDGTKKIHDMEYILDLKESFFDTKSLVDKDWIFADPMNATGGSFITILNWLLKFAKPKSIKFFNIITSLKGALNVIRAVPECEVYSLWMDPVLNDKAYIMPGLGDAGDRINGADNNGYRNVIQLAASYDSNIAGLYKTQFKEIEQTILKLKG